MTTIILANSGYVFLAWFLSLVALIEVILFNLYLNKFSRLKYFELRSQVKKIKNKFNDIPIMSVKLYTKQPQYEFKINSIYAIVFEIDPKVEQLIKNNPSINSQFEELRDIGWLLVASDIEEFDFLGIDSDFSKVYKKKPSSNNFMKEWCFLIKISDSLKDKMTIVNMKVNVNKQYWSLF